MGTDERHTEGSYNAAKSLASECPDPRLLLGQPIGMYHCPECGEMQIAGMPHSLPDNYNEQPGVPDAPCVLCHQPVTNRQHLHCSRCNVVLAPVEAINLDLGVGPKLLCDACLGPLLET